MLCMLPIFKSNQNQICLIQTARSIQIYRMMMMMMMKRVSHNIKAIRTIGKHTHQHYILPTNADV